MVLNHLGVSIGYPRLSRLLRAGHKFTPFGHLRYLASLNLFITLGTYGDLSLIEPNIEMGLPIIVRVQTFGWQHWGREITEHAVVVVGVDQDNNAIFINDPFFADAPIEMPLEHLRTLLEAINAAREAAEQ
jgi:hypothetical protein